MSVERESAVYVNYCHQCGRALSSARTERCDRCAWLRCECGACGCNYEVDLPRPLLATVPPVWAGAPPRHGAAFADEARSSRPLPLLAGALAVVLVASAVAVGSHLTSPSADLPTGPSNLATPLPAAPEAGTSAPSAGSVAAPQTLVAVGASAEALPAPAEAAPPAPGPTTAAVAPPSLPAVLYVANTDGQGAYIRTQPRDGVDTRVFAWNDGTPMVPLELRSVGEGAASSTWIRVRDPRGQEGWLRQAYLATTR
jgi:hypothetical protein